MKDWQKRPYESYVKELEQMLNRKLTENELKHILWLSGWDKSTMDTFTALFRDLGMKGGKEDVQKR